VRIGLYVPCYRGVVRLEHMRSHTDNREWALSQNHEVGELDTQSCHIDPSRNEVVALAVEHGVDRLLMMDADVGVARPANGLAHLMARMDETGAAAVGAVVLRRTGSPNVFDDGQSVGTGLILIDLHQLKRIAPPWFERRCSPDGTDVRVTGDIAFCRLLRARGLRVVVDDALPTVHIGEAVHQFSPPATVMSGSRDGAPIRAVETAHV
jgi:hypothetical protein